MTDTPEHARNDADVKAGDTDRSTDAKPKPKRKRNLRRRLIILCSVGVVLVLAALGYLYFLGPIPPAGEGPAGPAVPAEPFAQTWTTRPVLLLGIGDSVTDGYGATDGKSYLERLYANPADEWPEMEGRCLGAVCPDLTLLNRAVSASDSPECERNLRFIEVQQPDVFGIVCLTTGGNDLIHDYGRSAPREAAMYGATLEQAEPWIAAFEARLHRILDGVAARFPGGHAVFMANIYDPTDGVGNIERVYMPTWKDGLAIHARYNAVIARVAAARPEVVLVDNHALMLGHGLNCTWFWHEHYHADDPHYWYFKNLEDPNDRGYDAIRRAMLLAMIACFKANPIPPAN